MLKVIAAIVIAAVFGFSYGQSNVPTLSISPNGEYFAITHCDSTCGIFEKNLKTGMSILIKDKNRSLQAPSYSLDGRYITVLMSNKKGDEKRRSIAVIDKVDYSVQQITIGDSFDFSPVFHPNGKSIIFARASREKNHGRVPVTNYDAFQIDIDGKGEPKRLSGFGLYSMGNPIYFENMLIFSSLDEKGRRLYKYDFKNDMQLFIKDDGSHSLQGASHSHKLLLLVKRVDSTFSVVTLHPDGSLAEQINEDIYIGRASISEDAGVIGYIRGRQNLMEIVLVDRETKHRKIYNIKSFKPNKTIIVKEK